MVRCGPFSFLLSGSLPLAGWNGGHVHNPDFNMARLAILLGSSFPANIFDAELILQGPSTTYIDTEDQQSPLRSGTARNRRVLDGHGFVDQVSNFTLKPWFVWHPTSTRG